MALFCLTNWVQLQLITSKFIKQPSLTVSTAQKPPEFVGIKFKSEDKTSLVKVKNVKSGVVKEGQEVVVDFNGKDEKATVVVLNGKYPSFLILLTRCLIN